MSENPYQNPKSQGVQILKTLQDTPEFHLWMADQIRPYLGLKNLEVGAGLGALTKILYQNHPLEAVEPSAPLREELKRILPGLALHDLDTFASEKALFDCIYSSNVMEHIEDDLAFLNYYTNKLKIGGYLIGIVPAHPLLFSRMDTLLGHYRRYNKPKIKFLLQKTNHLELIRQYYINPVGALGWLSFQTLLGQTRFRPSSLTLFEKLVPWLRYLDRFPCWFGQSLIFVLRRTS